MAGEATMVERCLGCGKALKPGEMVIPDVSGDYLHAKCCGPEREGYFNLDTGEPIGPDDPIPTGFAWEPA